MRNSVWAFNLAAALTATLYGHFTEAIYRNGPVTRELNDDDRDDLNMGMETSERRTCSAAVSRAWHGSHSVR